MKEYKLIDSREFSNIKDLGQVFAYIDNEKYFVKLVIGDMEYRLRTTRGGAKFFSTLEALFSFLRLQNVTDVNVNELLK